jgi:dihydrofolate reductase
MSKVFSAHAVSVDGYITGRDPAPGRGLGDEVILHQVPVLLGAGRPFFQALPEHVRLHLLEAVPAPGVTHLRYEVAR